MEDKSSSNASPSPLDATRHSSNETPAPSGPVRVRLSRAKGWKMPPNTVKVDRSTKWGNPYRAGDIHPYANSEDFADPTRVEELRIDAGTAVALYGLGCATANMLSNGNPFAVLRGKNLACWCALDAPCHANVLLELANAPSDAARSASPRRFEGQGPGPNSNSSISTTPPAPRKTTAMESHNHSEGEG